MGTYFTEGIVLKHQDFRESDRIIFLYTREYGKIKALARGSRKITSKLAGSLEPYILADFMVARGRKLDTITSSEVIRNFKKLKVDLQKVGLASYLAEVVDSSTKVHQRDVRVFKLIKEIFTHLDRDGVRVDRGSPIIWYFIWRFLAYLGYQPELYKCLICHNKILLQKNYFNLKKGGLVCQNCQPKVRGSVFVSNNAIKVLRLIIDKSWLDLEKVSIDNKTSLELDRLTKDFFNFTQEKELLLGKFLLGK